MPSSEFRETDRVGGRSTRAWEDRVLLPVVLAREAASVAVRCGAEHLARGDSEIFTE